MRVSSTERRVPPLVHCGFDVDGYTRSFVHIDNTGFWQNISIGLLYLLCYQSQPPSLPVLWTILFNLLGKVSVDQDQYNYFYLAGDVVKTKDICYTCHCSLIILV